MIRVLIADDEDLIRAGVAAILNSDPDICVVGEAADGAQALTQCRALTPDVALLDIAMPGLTGFETATQIKRAVPGCAIVVLTTFDRNAYVTEALEQGLNGFVLKASSPQELAHAVRVAHSGGTYISPRITARLITAATPADTDMPAGLADLTPREIDVLKLLAGSESNQGIARQMHVSEGTVKVHMKAILRKLGVDNRVRAALIGHRAGLVGPGPSPSQRRDDDATVMKLRVDQTLS